MRSSIWQDEHIDYLEQLMRHHDLTTQAMATHMSRRFRRRITATHITNLLGRMRKPSDPFFRNIPYRHTARFVG